MIITMMKVVYKAPFLTVGDALSFFNSCNPARAKSINLFEPERGQKQISEDFSGQSANDIWASVTVAIQRVISNLDHDRKWSFIWRNVGDRSRHLAAEDIASRLKTSPQVIRRYLRETTRTLERELRHRDLLEPEWTRIADAAPPLDLIIVIEDYQGRAEFAKAQTGQDSIIIRDLSGSYRHINEFCQWRALKDSEALTPIKFS